MATYFKRTSVHKIIQSLIRLGQLGFKDGRKLEDSLVSLIRVREASKMFKASERQLELRADSLSTLVGEGWKESVVNDKVNLSDTENVYLDKDFIRVQLDNREFSQHILKNIQQAGPSYGYERLESSPETVLVEYSSPNIAKPFHAGHLRSTIIGNVIANLYEALGHNVIRLNFLGDWGTQFGLLAAGFKKYGQFKKLEERDPMLHLFEVYVRINQDVSAEDESDMRKKATYAEGLELFRKLEQGDPEIVSLWKTFRKITMEENNKMYERLGIKFTETHTESMYNDKVKDIVKRLEKEGLLKYNESGVGYMDVMFAGRLGPAKLVKSDGTSLYLSRDVSAAVDRYERFKFDRMHYVVEMGQRSHFEQLIGVLRLMKEPWILERELGDVHIQFGRIEGMSTRKGEVIFLRDIVDEAKSRMIKTLKEKQTTRDGIEVEEVSDRLGISSIIVQDLKDRRIRNYKFSWDRMLNFKSDSGVFLQYCHARLCSMQRTCGVDLQDGAAVDSLVEEEAQQLVLHMARYPDVVQKAWVNLEPCYIVQYLFRLAHLTNVAYSHLPVKGQHSDVAQVGQSDL
ncbi:probable arginine--tRNA ligase, mitochondrial [Gigantopelta aegis]|uniref:probable arginine--tRNA ligase, mitochondrial n=1 Tax=Gigantopelta aegis TaxID=1735272 RepID=UPI001B88B109|nr:probable arginine--tRNA ligase, mitochondrial [Gigantopelta aegis]